MFHAIINIYCCMLVMRVKLKISGGSLVSKIRREFGFKNQAGLCLCNAATPQTFSWDSVMCRSFFFSYLPWRGPLLLASPAMMDSSLQDMNTKSGASLWNRNTQLNLANLSGNYPKLCMTYTWKRNAISFFASLIMGEGNSSVYLWYLLTVEAGGRALRRFMDLVPK